MMSGNKFFQNSSKLWGRKYEYECTARVFGSRKNSIKEIYKYEREGKNIFEKQEMDYLVDKTVNELKHNESVNNDSNLQERDKKEIRMQEIEEFIGSSAFIRIL